MDADIINSNQKIAVGIKGDVENIIDGRFTGWWTIEPDNKEAFEKEKRMVNAIILFVSAKISEKTSRSFCTLLD